jgi:hypothetical protein
MEVRLLHVYAVQSHAKRSALRISLTSRSVLKVFMARGSPVPLLRPFLNVLLEPACRTFWIWYSAWAEGKEHA